MGTPTDHSRRIHDAVGARNANSVISTSWRRSLLRHGLEPDDGDYPKRQAPETIIETLRSAAALVEVSKRHLDVLFDLIQAREYCVLLSDADGIVVDMRTSSKEDFWNRPSSHWLGTDLSERSEGTNATGTALIEQRPVKVEDGEHFHTRNVHIVCDGAPIYGADGTIVGSIDVARSTSDESDQSGALIMFAVIETVRRIELSQFRRAYPKARLTLSPAPSGSVVSALLATDGNDLVVGATHTARQALDIDERQMARPFPAEQIWKHTEIAGEGLLAAAERRVILRTLAKHGDNVSAAAKALGISRGTLHRKRAQWPS